MKLKKASVVLALSAMSALALNACGSPANQPAASSSAASASAEAAKEGTQAAAEAKSADAEIEKTVEAAVEEGVAEAVEEATAEAVEEVTAEAEAEAAAEAAEEAADESSIGLDILIEEDESMINTYSLLAVNPESPWVDADGNAVDASTVKINTAGADALINWMLSEEGLDAAANYGFDEYGEYLFYINDDAPVSEAEIPEATDDTKVIRMSTTTSVNDSGLLGYLLPIFETEYGYTVEVTSAGTGKAIANAKMGNADLLLVHAKAQEEDFISAGFARKIDGQDQERLSFMYNYFVLCGPEADPAEVTSAADVKEAFASIAENKCLFVSRGDASGTHTKELSLWPESLGITEDPASFEAYKDWYISANAGMGVCLTMANEQGAYILSDKATFLTFRANGGILE